MNRLFTLSIVLLATLFFTACIEDDISSSAADQPTFSVDTLAMGRVFTGEGTPTYSFRVYNRHDKVISISDISFADADQTYFRINVDGRSGTRFSNVEIRPNDSIFVFVDANIPADNSTLPIDIEQKLNFVTQGVTSSVIITARGQNVTRLHGKVIERDTVWADLIPHQIFDSLVIAPGATLTIGPGCRLYFHDGSELRVRGTLITQGTAEKPVTMGGDRTGYVAADIPYEIMSRQWQGVYFAPTSHANALAYTTIENTWTGVTLDSLSAGNPNVPAIEMINCRLRNSAGTALSARFSSISATGCEFAEGGKGVVSLTGGNNYLSYCTISNNYLFSYMGGAMLQLHHLNSEDSESSAEPYMRAYVTNSIIYGSGAPLSVNDLTDTQVWLKRCLLGVTGEDDEHFISILWDSDPMWYTDRSIYRFDYRLQPDSPALGASYQALTPPQALPLPPTDFYGDVHPDPAAIGAMEAKPE